MKKVAWCCLLSLLAGITACKKTEEVQLSNQPRFELLAPADHPSFVDSFPHQGLPLAIDAQLRWFRANRETIWRFGERLVSVAEMIDTLTAFRAIWVEDHDRPTRLQKRIAEAFDVYQLSFGSSPGILVTGYYAPIFEGSLEKDGVYRYPLYRRPDDLLAIRPSRFDTAMLRPGETLRGDRVMARMAKGEVLPYFTRRQIDEQSALAGKNLELVYLDDYFNAFTLHVQGGGFVRLPSGRYLSVQYAGKNGWPYTSIGRFLVAEGTIPAEEISMQAIGTYFEQNPAEVTRVCYQNRSYVFYTSDGQTHAELKPEFFPSGVLGFPVTPKRSIATDKRFFAGGGLAFVSSSQRQLDGTQQPFSAFALDQDTGGAIKGAHIDFFHGAGERAAEDAGLLNDSQGRVYFLVIKENVL